MGFRLTSLMKGSVVSLQLIPLSLAYAVVRYRLMDVDILFRRGYAYTLATLCVLAPFYAIIFSLATLVQKNFQDLGNTRLTTPFPPSPLPLTPHPHPHPNPPPPPPP